MRADGPHIAFHGSSAAYVVTLFSAPDPLVAGPVQLSILVQRANEETLADRASARGELALPGQPTVAFTFTPGAGGNPRLLGASVRLPRPGSYALRLQLAGGAGGGAGTEFTGVLPVAPDNGKRNSVLWAVFVPLAVSLLFLANQYGKQRLGEARARSRDLRV